MFAFVKNLFRRRAPQAAPAKPAFPTPAPAHQPSPKPAETSAAVAAPSVVPQVPRPTPVATHPKPAPSSIPSQPVARAEAPPVFSKETVDLSLKALWPKLKAEVTQRATSAPKGDSLLRLPLNIVQAHLAKGSMNIPYAQLRQFAPPGLFPESPAHEAETVSIPISEILPRLKPEHLSKRAGQRKVVVPDDIEPIFGPDAGAKGNLRLAHGKSSNAGAPAPHAPAATPTPVPAAPTPAPQAPSAPAVSAAPAAVAAPAPAATPVVAPAQPRADRPTPAPKPVVPAQISPITPISPIVPDPEPAATTSPHLPATASPTLLPAATPAPAVPPVPIAPLVSEPIRAPRLDPALASLKAQPAEKHVKLALMDVAGFWAEKGRIELEKLCRHSLEIPAATLEAALKKGKVEFAWREVRPWIRLAAGSSMPTVGDDVRIELPLSLVAPRFLELQSQHAAKKRVQIGDEIPDIFVRHLPEPAAPAEPPVENSPAPVAEAAPESPAPAPDENRLKEFGEIFGQPEKTDWSLGEVSQRTTTLPGVSGAIIATSDGLLVGGSWPNDVGGEAVAAFAPQMYNRMASYAKELKLGEPGRFTVLVENVPLQIFKSSNSYFTVLGRAGENLPERELNAIATRLAASLTEN